MCLKNYLKNKKVFLPLPDSKGTNIQIQIYRYKDTGICSEIAYLGWTLLVMTKNTLMLSMGSHQAKVAVLVLDKKN